MKDKILIKKVKASGGMWCKTTLEEDAKGKAKPKQEWTHEKPSSMV